MDLGLKGKIIVVTGGANGIGAGIVAVLAAEGAIPILFDNDEHQMNKVVEQFARKGIRVGGINVDLTHRDQCEKAVKNVLSEFGSIHGLVNNAGINDGVGLERVLMKLFYNPLNAILFIIIRWHSCFFQNLKKLRVL